ncbi:MAG TPA: hypothetical protein VN783_04775 [Thermoanaerobaculia bacterium]|nr:hypothetical protein [Thermoanaerobaculia bacterium]
MDVTDLAASASDPFARAFQLAEIGVETAAQLARLALCPDRYTPAALVAQGAGLALRAGECARQALSAPDLLWAALELANKAEVFALVKGVALLIGEPLAGPLPILPLIERAYALGDFPALWAVEGLGHDYAESVWRESGPPRGLLADRGVAAELPEASLLMLHAGMGLAFADRLLPGSAAAPAREIRRAVAEIVALDRANSRPGYLGPALESLGLIARLFRCAAMVPAVDRALAAVAPEARGYFWHGAGRALYFLPESFLPGSTWLIFQMAEQMAGQAAPGGRDLARANALAGAAWAELLVNQRRPEILWQLIVRPHGERLLDSGAGFANGVASALVMRRDTTPGAAFERAFLDFRPSDGTARERAAWERLVGVPGRRAVEVAYPILRAENRLGEIFRVAPLPGAAGGAA